jgi:undecaprenyl-diphosphatase
MFQVLENADRALFLYLNGKHCDLCDKVMPVLTELWVWIPLFAWWFFELYKKHKKKVAVIILCVVALVFCTDQGANLIKKSVKRYRPTHNLEIQQQVHAVNNYKGGQFGFVSNHAANVWGISFFVFFLLRPAKKIVVFSLFAWAIFICYSRIYLGVHYPLDILGGAIWGTLCAIAVYRITRMFV